MLSCQDDDHACRLSIPTYVRTRTVLTYVRRHPVDKKKPAKLVWSPHRDFAGFFVNRVVEYRRRWTHRLRELPYPRYARLIFTLHLTLGGLALPGSLAQARCNFPTSHARPCEAQLAGSRVISPIMSSAGARVVRGMRRPSRRGSPVPLMLRRTLWRKCRRTLIAYGT